jgi:hypothetical protein
MIETARENRLYEFKYPMILYKKSNILNIKKKIFYCLLAALGIYFAGNNLQREVDIPMGKYGLLLK